jgi:Amt family ammonium transporter
MFLAAAVCFGVVGGTICNFATQLKFLLDYDDALDIFAVHGIGGMVGNVCSTLLIDLSLC